MLSIQNHPDRNVIRVQLAQNIVLKGITTEQSAELESHLVIVDGQKGDSLLHQGVHEMEQYFILEGILKRVVTNEQAKEMIPPGAWALRRLTARSASPKFGWQSCPCQNGSLSWNVIMKSSSRSSIT
jgi:hypothetical protein